MTLTTGRSGSCSEECDCHEVDFNLNLPQCLFGCEGSRHCLSAEFTSLGQKRFTCKHCFIECYTTTPRVGSWCYRRDPPRTNPCLKALKDGKGLYPVMIAAQFPPDIVRKSGARRNLFCDCINQSRMRCKITVEPDSLHAAAVFRRLDRNNPMELQPFFIDPDLAGTSLAREVLPLLFRETGSQVTAEIWVDSSRKHLLRHWAESSHEAEDSEKVSVKPIRRKKPYSSSPRITELHRVNSSPQLSHEIIESEPPRLRRSRSAPEALHYATNGIPMNLCGEDAVCPITQMPFEPGFVVYVLKSEVSNIALGKEVVCLSASGLKSMSIRSSKFVDPLKRENARPLGLNDYEKYVLLDIVKYDSSSSFDDTLFRPSSQHLQHLDASSPQEARFITDPDDDFDDEINRPVNAHLRKDDREIHHLIEVGESEVYMLMPSLKYILYLLMLISFIILKFFSNSIDSDILMVEMLSEEL